MSSTTKGSAMRSFNFGMTQHINQDPSKDDLQKMEDLIKRNKRSRLHNIETLKWLKNKSLANQTIKKNYLMYPEEMEQEVKIKKIFLTFDDNDSGALDLREMVQMFHEYKIEVDRQKLEEMYRVVNGNGDGALNFQQFKECALSDQANQVFSTVIKDVEKREQIFEDPDQRNIYLPRNFASMINYISYLMSRKQKQSFINNKDDKMKATDKMLKFQLLIQMNDLQTPAIEEIQTKKLQQKKEEEILKASEEQLQQLSKNKQKGLKFIRLDSENSNKLEVTDNSEQDLNIDVFKQTQQEMKYVFRKAKSQGRIQAKQLYNKMEDFMSQQRELQFNQSLQEEMKITQQKFKTTGKIRRGSVQNLGQGIKTFDSNQFNSKSSKNINLNKTQQELLKLNKQIGKDDNFERTQSFKDMVGAMQEHMKSLETKNFLNIQIKKEPKQKNQLKPIMTQQTQSKHAVKQDLDKSQQQLIVKEIKSELFDQFDFDNKAQTLTYKQNKRFLLNSRQHQPFSEVSLLSHATPRLQSQQVSRTFLLPPMPKKSTKKLHPI